MSYIQFTQIIDTISKKINWEYKVTLAPHVSDSEFIQDSDHPFTHEVKEKKKKKKKMTMDDIKSFKNNLK